jgi:hypothetical protein
MPTHGNDVCSTGSGSVTVMTVALAFTAFAKARPCHAMLYLATSEPSVLKRIFEYIPGAPLLVEHFPNFS